MNSKPETQNSKLTLGGCQGRAIWSAFFLNPKR